MEDPRYEDFSQMRAWLARVFQELPAPQPNPLEELLDDETTDED